jgi:glutathione S-transferase
VRLYDYPRSGNCHKIRFLLSLLGLDYERTTVDSTTGETLTPEFRRLNPRGQIPVLDDGGTIIWDSLAILVYLARRAGGEPWLPADALGEARVMQWLAVSENELLYGLARARAVVQLGRPFDLDLCQREGSAGLDAMEGQLAAGEWLAADHPTIADIACFPYVALSQEGGVSPEPYPAVQAWVRRIKRLPGFLPMPGIDAD